MEDLNAVLVFLKIAELSSFVAAARSLDLPKSTVSLKVNELEQRLNVRLLHRTTRRVSLTEEERAGGNRKVRQHQEYDCRASP